MAMLVEEFAREAELTDAFCLILSAGDSPWGQVQFAREFGYIRGRTDVIATNDASLMIAFELKLKKWRKALDQAYRNTSFAHRSYVVLPKSVALWAQRFSAEFQQRTVGLCYVADGAVTILVQAVEQQPIQPWLSEAALAATQQ